MADTNQALGDTLLVAESLQKPLLTEDHPEMPVGNIPASDETAATASNTAANTALSDYAPDNVDLTLSDVSAPEKDPVHADQQGGVACSSVESTDCGTKGDVDAADGDDNKDDTKNEEKKRQREIKRIMRQRRRENEETKDAPRALEDGVATLHAASGTLALTSRITGT